MSAAFEKEVLQRLAVIETKVDDNNYDPQRCATHDEKLKVANHRIKAIEKQQGKQNLIAMTMGAIGTGLALTMKFIFTKG